MNKVTIFYIIGGVLLLWGLLQFDSHSYVSDPDTNDLDSIGGLFGGEDFGIISVQPGEFAVLTISSNENIDVQMSKLNRQNVDESDPERGLWKNESEVTSFSAVMLGFNAGSSAYGNDQTVYVYDIEPSNGSSFDWTGFEIEIGIVVYSPVNNLSAVGLFIVLQAFLVGGAIKDQ